MCALIDLRGSRRAESYKCSLTQAQQQPARRRTRAQRSGQTMMTTTRAWDQTMTLCSRHQRTRTTMATWALTTTRKTMRSLARLPRLSGRGSSLLRRFRSGRAQFLRCAAFLAHSALTHALSRGGSNAQSRSLRTLRAMLGAFRSAVTTNIEGAEGRTHTWEIRSSSRASPEPPSLRRQHRLSCSLRDAQCARSSCS